MSVHFNSNLENVNFIAAYSDKRIQNRKRFLLLCLTNPVGCVIGSLYLINELFKSILLKLGRSTLFGSRQGLQIRNYTLIDRLKEGMGGEHLKLKTPDGRILEAMHVKAQCKQSTDTHQKTVLLFTGSHRSYEFFACPIIEAYRERGCNVLCINYGGFGDSEGAPSEHHIELDAETAYQYILKNHSNNEICAHGYSLGSYPALHLAKNYPIKKIVCDRGFSKISNVTRDTTLQISHPKVGIIVSKIIAFITQSMVNFVGSLNNLKNLNNLSGDLLCARADSDSKMLKYHVDLIHQYAPKTTVIDFQGTHLHSADEPAWFTNNETFWNWFEDISIS